jgi:hypothetical protein
MNIAIMSDFNIAGQPTALMRAINKYTHHKARCIIAYDDNFAFDKDIILKVGDNWLPEACKEASDWVKQSQFFFFGRGVFDWPGIHWSNTTINKNNCCIKYYGSELRNHYPTIKLFHDKTGIAAITGTDWSITGRLTNSFYHLGSYFTKFGDMDMNEVPMCKQRKEGEPFRIAASSAGSPLKGYDFLFQTIEELKAEGVPIELEIMTQLTNKEVLERKLNCQATFTSLHGGWGISGIESMWLGHAVFSCLDPWVMTLYPDNPTIFINKDSLKRKLREATERGVMAAASTSRMFVAMNFNSFKIMKRYLYLFDLIMHNEEYLKGWRNPESLLLK